MTAKKGLLEKDKFAEIQYYTIDAVDEVALTQDLLNVFIDLATEFHSETGQVLIFIDATNGNLTINSFDSGNSQTVGDYFIFISLSEFWRDNQNSYDFDEIVMSSIKSALKFPNGNSFLKKYNLFLQTEQNRAQELMQNTL